MSKTSVSIRKMLRLTRGSPSTWGELPWTAHWRKQSCCGWSTIGQSISAAQSFPKTEEPIRRLNRGCGSWRQLNGSKRKENGNQTQTSNKKREESFYSEVKTKSFVVSWSCKNCSLLLEQGWILIQQGEQRHTQPGVASVWLSFLKNKLGCNVSRPMCLPSG